MLSSSAARLPPVAVTAVSQSGNMIHLRPQTSRPHNAPCLAKLLLTTWVTHIPLRTSCVGLSLVGSNMAVGIYTVRTAVAVK